MSMLSLSGLEGSRFDRREGVDDALLTLRRRAGAQLRHWTLSVAGAIAIAAGAVLLARSLAAEPRPVPVASAAVRNPWIEIAHPLRFYALDSAEFGREPRAYEARRHREGGGREDSLLFGAAVPGKETSVRVSIYRKGAEAAPDSRFFVEMARQAARSGLSVARSAQPGELPTRFGVMEAADIVLTTSSGEASCLGFLLDAATPGLRISGFACGAPNKPMDRRTLACGVDRLDLIAAGDDRELARFFVTAELARGKGCGGAKGGSSSWLEPGAGKPALRDGDAPRPLARR